MFLTACNFSGSSGSDSDTSEKSYIILPKSEDEVVSSEKAAASEFNRQISRVEETDQKDFENIVYALNDAVYEYKKAGGINYTAAYLSTDKKVRNAATAQYYENEKNINSLYFNKNIYDKIDYVLSNSQNLSSEEKNLAEKFLNDFEKNGINLTESDQNLQEEISSELSLLKSEFSKNIQNINEKVVLTPEELEGVPDSELKNLSKDDSGNYLVGLKISMDRGIVLKYAEKESVRKKVFSKFYSVAKEKNPEILEKIIQLRAKKAAVLGFNSFGDFKTSDRMAKSADNAIAFVKNLAQKSQSKFEQEKTKLLELKKTYTSNTDAVLNNWDLSFYKNKYDKENFDLNHTEMKKYFSLDNCINGLFNNFENLFNIEITKLNVSNDLLWHEDVTVYQVKDGESKKLLGLFYLDLYPRDGKFNHFASFFTYIGNVYSDKKEETPSGVLVGNWKKPENNNPSLITFGELTTLFHEFGHTLNLLLMNSKFAELRQNSQDFVEIPSTMAEQWCYDYDVLKSFAVNHENKDDLLPSDYLEKIKKSKNAFSATGVLSTSSYALSDLKIHTEFNDYDSVDVTGIFNDILENYYFAQPEGISRVSRFEHIVAGYGAGYYSYLWSEAVVYDLKTVFDKTGEGLLSKEVALDLRKKIYEPGIKVEEDESVHRFLGRDWNVDAYIEHIQGTI
jgi:thimet oligopeptidase